jgi:16S rRNA (adenine1518-N6/adenine1519-N6)-dimethyltransferase
MLERVTAAAFGQRRKMLRASLKGLPGAIPLLEPLGIDPSQRAEQLAVGDFCRLSAALSGAKNAG